jgi:hypothetical protein
MSRINLNHSQSSLLDYILMGLMGSNSETEKRRNKGLHSEKEKLFGLAVICADDIWNIFGVVYIHIFANMCFVLGFLSCLRIMNKLDVGKGCLYLGAK